MHTIERPLGRSHRVGLRVDLCSLGFRERLWPPRRHARVKSCQGVFLCHSAKIRRPLRSGYPKKSARKNAWRAERRGTTSVQSFALDKQTEIAGYDAAHDRTLMGDGPRVQDGAEDGQWGLSRLPVVPLAGSERVGLGRHAARAPRDSTPRGREGLAEQSRGALSDLPQPRASALAANPVGGDSRGGIRPLAATWPSQVASGGS